MKKILTIALLFITMMAQAQNEIGMQNAAQVIAIAASPFVLADSAYAIPAIIYALLMNVVLLVYVGLIRSINMNGGVIVILRQ